MSTAENTVVCTYISRHHPVLGRGMPHLVLISVLLSSDPKISSCLQDFFAQKFPRLGVFELFFAEEILGEENFPKIFLVTPVFMVVTKFCTKIFILPKILPTRFCFTFHGNKILYKIFRRFSDGRKYALLAKS